MDDIELEKKVAALVEAKLKDLQPKRRWKFHQHPDQVRQAKARERAERKAEAEAKAKALAEAEAAKAAS